MAKQGPQDDYFLLVPKIQQNARNKQVLTLKLESAKYRDCGVGLRFVYKLRGL